MHHRTRSTSHLLACSMGLALATSGCDLQRASSLDEASAADPQSSEGARAQRVTMIADVVGTSMVEAPDGSIYVAGVTGRQASVTLPRYESLWLGKVGPDGAIAWSITEPKAALETVPVRVGLDRAGALYVLLGDMAGGSSVLEKRDPQGSLAWSVAVEGEADALAVRPEGGAFVASAIVTGANDHSEVSAIGADGERLWSRDVVDPFLRWSRISHAELTRDGGLLLGGVMAASIDHEPEGNDQAWLGELEPAAGALRWGATLTEPTTHARLDAIGSIDDGTILVAGERSYYDAALDELVEEPWVRAVEPGGAQQWAWRSDVVEAHEAFGVFADGGFAVGEPGYGPSGVPTSMILRRFEVDRALAWSAEVASCTQPRALVPAADDGLFVLAACAAEGAEDGSGLLYYAP